MRVGGEMVGSVTVGMRLGNGFKKVEHQKNAPTLVCRSGGASGALRETRDKRAET